MIKDDVVLTLAGIIVVLLWSMVALITLLIFF